MPVAYWELKSDAAKVVADISDLATDATGQLYVLSDQSRVIARIERELISDEGKIDLKAVYELPKAVDKPEGLLLVGGAPLVTVDQPSLGAKTLFRLDSL